MVGDTAKVTYQWGPRAVCEVDKRSLLKMVAEVRAYTSSVYWRRGGGGGGGGKHGTHMILYQ